MRSQALQVFSYEDSQVRTVILDGEPWFVAKDVAEVLGYKDATNAVKAHCKGVAKHHLPSASGTQETNIIPERDLYRLIMKSKLPAAERFEDWVVGEVLPAIRKTGGYQVAPQFQIPQTYAAALQLAADQAREIEEKTLLIEDMTPKAEFFDTVTESKDAVDIGTVAKVLNMGIGRTNLFKFLRENNILMAKNQPYQEYIDRGYFRVIESHYDKPDGSSHVSFKTVVYQKGIDFIRRRLQESKQ